MFVGTARFNDEILSMKKSQKFEHSSVRHVSGYKLFQKNEATDRLDPM